MTAETAPAQQQPTPAQQQQIALAAMVVLLLSPRLPRPQLLEKAKAALIPLGVTAEAVEWAVKLAALSFVLPPRGGVGMAAVRRTAPAFRAAYVLQAARRYDESRTAAQEAFAAADRLEQEALQTDEASGEALRAEAERLRRTAPISDVRERQFLGQHLNAERARVEAAQKVDEAAAKHGRLLGWHAELDSATTPECRAAHGRNFYADRPPLIGLPGTLHGGTCRCRPGPPFARGTLLL